MSTEEQRQAAREYGAKRRAAGLEASASRTEEQRLHDNAMAKARYDKNIEQKREYFASKQRSRFITDPSYRMRNDSRMRAKKAGLPFNLTEEDFLIPEFCPVLGIPLVAGVKHKHDGSPSLDRFIPELGYVKGNVAIISFKANRIKNNGSSDDVERVAKWMKMTEAMRS